MKEVCRAENLASFTLRSADSSHCDASECNYAVDILIKYMTHELAEIRSAVYCSIAMLVAVNTRLAR
jgi:hypothetical protein